MNAARRSRLAFLVADLRALEAEEREAFENLPDQLQCTARAEAMEEAADAMQSAADDLEGYTS